MLGNTTEHDLLVQVSASVDIQGIYYKDFSSDAQNNFCISVADVLAIPVRDVGILAVSAGPTVEGSSGNATAGSVKTTLIKLACVLPTGKLGQ